MPASADICRKLVVMMGMLLVVARVLLAATITMGQTRGLTGGGAEIGERQLPTGNLLSQPENTATQSAGIIPDERMTTWNPGLNAVSGIPNRTTIYRTLSPRGGSLDDTAAIQRALDACPRGQVVKLSPGTFNINGGGLHIRGSDCTLRGSGTGKLGSGDGGTRLIKADRDTNRNFAVLYVGNSPGQFSSSINLAADAIKGANSLTLVSTPRVKAGDIVLIDQVTDNDPRVWWGPQQDPPGGGSRRWFARQDRSLAQIMEVTGASGNTVTFSTPFHITYKAEYAAQLSHYANDNVLHGVGIEGFLRLWRDGRRRTWQPIDKPLRLLLGQKYRGTSGLVGTSVGFYTRRIPQRAARFVYSRDAKPESRRCGIPSRPQFGRIRQSCRE